MPHFIESRMNFRKNFIISIEEAASAYVIFPSDPEFKRGPLHYLFIGVKQFSFLSNHIVDFRKILVKVRWEEVIITLFRVMNFPTGALSQHRLKPPQTCNSLIKCQALLLSSACICSRKNKQHGQWNN